jgi:hypothetical protein
MATAETETSNIFFVTHFDRTWADEHHHLEYENVPFNDKETQKRWQDIGHDYKYYTGDLYDMRRPQPEYVKSFGQLLGWENCTTSFYCMTPGRILPEHNDTYQRYRQIFNIDNPYSIWRAIIFLEDWQSGHYLEVSQCPITQWQAGDCVLWQYNTPHLAANLGQQNRYTVQLTGTVNDSQFTQRMGPTTISSGWDSGEFALPE